MKKLLKNGIKRLIGQKMIDRVTSKDPWSGIAVHPEDRKIIDEIKSRHLTYLSNRKLAGLVSACRELDSSGVGGAIVEAGCALGGSSILLAKVKRQNRSLFVYDVFGMIPPPSENDTPDVHERYETIVNGGSKGLGGNKYYGYENDLYGIVQNNFSSFGVNLESQSVSLVKGLVQDTLNVDAPVAMAHIDVDWYDPVMTCLERIFPRLTAGGCIILDDYYDWGGCRKAADEYLERIKGQYRLDDSAGSMRIIKTL